MESATVPSWEPTTSLSTYRRRFVLHSDVTFAVWSDEAKLGELQVSKGSIDWLPGNGRTRYRMRWKRFNEIMKEGDAPHLASHAVRQPNPPGLHRRHDVAACGGAEKRFKPRAVRDDGSTWISSRSTRVQRSQSHVSRTFWRQTLLRAASLPGASR